MTSLEHRARQEAEKRWPFKWQRVPGIFPSSYQVSDDRHDPFVDGARWAASLPRELPTVADVEALPWFVFEDDDSEPGEEFVRRADVVALFHREETGR